MRTIITGCPHLADCCTQLPLSRLFLFLSLSLLPSPVPLFAPVFIALSPFFFHIVPLFVHSFYRSLSLSLSLSLFFSFHLSFVPSFHPYFYHPFSLFLFASFPLSLSFLAVFIPVPSLTRLVRDKKKHTHTDTRARKKRIENEQRIKRDEIY